MGNKKRVRREERLKIHHRNKYSENPPDFELLASLYPSFQPYVFYTRQGRPNIRWSDFNATRQLTQVLLLHDHNLNWWIPDGQLCPTVPNRSNYIHWVEDLLSSEVIPKTNETTSSVRGFDIGTGANCIYPLLGATLLGWSFVGSDVTDVALEWAEKNVKSNPHIAELIEIRKVSNIDHILLKGEVDIVEGETHMDLSIMKNKDRLIPSSLDVDIGVSNAYHRSPVLLGVVKNGESFDFCMCNPPFFESMEEAGLNPKTSCGGTLEEMVCCGGEHGFITRIIEDSVLLKQSFRWYTSMLGRKTNLKSLISKLREVGVTIVKTTEFVQGQTCRWGLAWSFVPPATKIVLPHGAEKGIISFMLEGLQRQFSAIHVLEEVESFFLRKGASCKSNISLFTIDIIASKDNCNAILQNVAYLHDSRSLLLSPNEVSFRISVFQQIPGTLLVKGSLKNKHTHPASGTFCLILEHLEKDLKNIFINKKNII